MSKNQHGSDLVAQGAVEIAARSPWSVYAFPHGDAAERRYTVVDHSRGVLFRLAHTGDQFQAGGDLARIETRHPAVAADVLRMVDCHARHADTLGDAWHPVLSDWLLPDPEGRERFGIVIRPKVPGWSRPEIKNRNL